MVGPGIKPRKIAVVTSTRALYGYDRRIMKLIDDSEELELQAIVTGMHLLKEYGLSAQEVERDGFQIAAKVDMCVGGDTPVAFAKSLGVCIQSMAQVFEMLSPDILLISGDRGEILATVMTAAYMSIPVAHIQSGDLSGHIDGSARHAITKLSHIHFPSCDDSAKRVEKLGEEPWRIFMVGSPQLDDMVRGQNVAPEVVAETLGLDLGKQTAIVVQHPVLAEQHKAEEQMIETMEAIKQVGIQTVVIYPNVDSAGQEIVKVIDRYSDLPLIKVCRNLDRGIFLGLAKTASVLVGNSSSGILEAPSFKLAAVNIGNRQRDRMQASNVINAPHDRQKIAEAIEKALHDPEFKAALSQSVNPYGDGYSSERIVKVLSEIGLGQELLDKKMTY